ncbi:MAG TPA: hypothetical protein VII50_03755 [Acidothermaceae bacterium]
MDLPDGLQLREERFIDGEPLSSDRELAVGLGKEIGKIGRCRGCRRKLSLR